MQVTQIMDRDLLQEMIDTGYVRVQTLPDSYLAILNYTEKATFEKVWNEVTTNCRGLIYDTSTLQIVARPFPKFFNYEELPPNFIDLDASVEVTDKMDGSLGILYYDERGVPAIATRGSFTSDQAIHATGVLRKKYKNFKPLKDFTYLFEIVYPGNRIVLNYGEVDDLVLLGAVNIRTGKSVGPYAETLGWPGPAAAVIGDMSLRQALALEPRKNAEGIVIYDYNSNKRMKLKQSDYVALHRIVTGMNERTIWQYMLDDVKPREIKEGLPEEFWSWVDFTWADLSSKVGRIIGDVYAEYHTVLARLENGNLGRPDRKEFALAVQDSPFKGYLFMLLDGKSIYFPVVRSLKPAPGNYMTHQSEG